MIIIINTAVLCEYEYFTDILKMEDVKVRSLELTKLGNQYFETGDYEKAIAYYDEAVILDPQHAIIYFNRGLLVISNNACGKIR